MRLIDADALKADLQKFFPEECLDGITSRTLFAQILTDISNAPTVEVRPQGECGKCDYRKFTETFIDGIVDVISKNGIADFDEFAKRYGDSYLHQDGITKSDTQI